ncbi:(S)-benzoin forming benzil reductase [Bacillus sp. FJAT-45037]|uniref:(S)-benzoin forming benzil reductase n=1 Tax=Bacillus sp. FJAT-45037 TaxID=2011007 RepID=UPI000C2302E0|nr:(S)-benzoin forming benzil reductase [Bacillus sp. FJAT-45037]
MNYLIITGASKGLGAEIVKAYAKKNAHIISISRTENHSLSQTVQEKGATHTQMMLDLSNIDQIASLVDNVFESIDLSHATSIHLINNAGLLAPVKPIERCSHEEMIKNHHVNLLAPMLLTSSFCEKVANLSIDKKIINISSGAAKRPIYGWSQYGSAKAGLDLFSQGVAVDQQETIHPVQVISFAPGIMDTNMQAEIRSTDKEDFINVETFKEYKKTGKLLPPATVANVIVDLLSADDFPNGEIVSVQDYL